MEIKFHDDETSETFSTNKDQQASEDLKVTHASYSPYNKKHLQMPIQIFKHKYF